MNDFICSSGKVLVCVGFKMVVFYRIGGVDSYLILGWNNIFDFV